MGGRPAIRRGRDALRSAAAGGALGLLGALAGCAAGPGPQAPGDEVGAHVVQGRELRETMRSLDRLRHARLPQELDLEAERARERREVARVAAEMAAWARRIPDAAVTAQLEPAEREAFARLAATLETRAAALADAANALPPAELDARLAALDATCDTCHQRFRLPRPR